MRTGRFCFSPHTLPPKLTWRTRLARWWRPGPAVIQVLLIEHDEPVDGSMRRGFVWRPATLSEAHAIQSRVSGECCALKNLS